MHASLRRAAERYGLELDIRASGAERIDLPSESVDAVLASLVLCTVDDQEAAIAEARRILRPGGRLLCIEHVAAPERSLVGRLQRLVFRPWRWFFEGCHTHRDTERALRAGGFSRVDVEHFTWPSAFVPVRPQIAATCAR
jgi:ubiquinone/menaquinone biosynthesis C-methylase UbiE